MSVSTIPLSQGKFAIVDAADHGWLSAWKWHFHVRGYALRNSPTLNGKRNIIRMHRIIMSAPDGMEVDHINGDKVDNRRANLRICTHAQNSKNKTQRAIWSSKHKGVCWFKETGQWMAYIQENGRRKHLGLFDNEDAAGLAYNAAAQCFYGEFANLNIIGEAV